MKTTLRPLVALATFLLTIYSYGQEFTAGINTETPNPNAVLHLVSPNGNQGLLVPSLTTIQRNAMTSALAATDNGLMVFDQDDNTFYFWVNPNWVANTNTDNQNLANVLSLGNDAGGAAIINVADPVNAQDVATKNYVDTQAESDPTVPANLKDGVDFSELTGVPVNLDLDQTDDVALTTVPATGDIEGNYQSGLNIAIGVVSSLEIQDATISDADVSGSANIAASKLDANVMVQGENVSLLTNDAGYLGSGDNISTLTNDAGYVTTEADPTVPANIKDGVDWTELSGIPAGFADGVDDGIATEVDPVWTGDRTTLGSAGTINTPTNLVDWSQLKNVPTDIADGVDDGIVTEVDPVWTGDRTTLGSAGTINTPTNLVDWSQLKNVPTDIADGVDDGIVTEVDPVWTGDRTTLGSAGTINTPTNLVDWSQLKNVPTDIADGVDDGIVTETDPTVPANIKDGIDWTELSGIPAGFADGVDDGIATEVDPVWTGDRTTLGSAGTINTPTNLVDWSQLKNVPTDIADGVDDGIVTETDPTVPANIKDGVDWTELSGIPAGFADGTDDGIVTEIDPVWTGDRTTLGSAGTINTPTNLVDWSQLKNVPADIADGVDDGIVLEADPTVPANIKDGVDWTELSGIPAGFFDGTDDGITTELDPVWTGDRTTLGSAGAINTPTNLVDWSQLKNVPTGIADGVDDGLTVVNSNATLNGDGAGTPLSVNTGTGPNQIVQLDASGFLPSVNGSAVTDLNPAHLATTTTPANGNVLTFNGATWDAAVRTSVLNTGSGVTINTNNIDLGGTLSAPATITTGAGSNDLTIDGAGRFISDAGIETSLRSPVINLGDANLDAVNVIGSMTVNEDIVFNELSNNLTLQVDDQTIGAGTLIIPDIGGGTDVIVLQSEVGSFIDLDDNNLAGNSAAAPSTGINNIVLGLGAGGSISSGSDNITIGTAADNSVGTTGGNIALGNTANANGGDAIALGTNTISSAQNSVAIGTATVANVPNTIVLGDGINSDFFVGIGVQDVRAPLQIGGELSFGHFENATEGINGDAIISNAYPDYTSPTDNQLRRSNGDSVSFIFFDDGEIIFLNAPNGTADTPLNLSDAGDVRSWMEMRNDGNVEVRGGLSVGDIDPGEEREGMIRWTGSNFEGNTNGSPGGWVSLSESFNVPYASGPVADGADLFSIQQTGAGRAGLFTVFNSGHNNPALEVRSNGDGATSYLARFDRTAGSTGSGVYIDMNGVNTPALLIDNTTAPIQIFAGASLGHVLTSDASGVGSWQPGFGIRDGSFNLYTPMAGTGGAVAASSGVDNIFLGRTVGNGVNTGSGNVLLGNEVTTTLTTGGGNVSIGSMSGGGTLVEGNNNIFIGTRAILGGGPSNSNNNISIGTDASSTLSSVAIGHNAFSNAPGSVAIGNGARATTLNTVTLGNASGTAYNLEVTGNTTLRGNLVSAVTNVTAVAAEGFAPASRIITLEASANITNIAAGTPGQEIILVTLGDAVVNEGGNIDLSTPSFNPGVPNSTLHLVYVGTTWVEISRSIK